MRHTSKNNHPTKSKTTSSDVGIKSFLILIIPTIILYGITFLSTINFYPDQSLTAQVGTQMLNLLILSMLLILMFNTWWICRSFQTYSRLALTFLTSVTTFGMLIIYSSFTINFMNADNRGFSTSRISLSSPVIIESLVLAVIPTTVVLGFVFWAVRKSQHS